MAQKIIITNKSDDVITNIVDTASAVSNGLLVKEGGFEYIIGFYNDDNCNKYEGVETTDNIAPQQYKYTTTGGFVANSNYVAPVDTNKQITDLQNGLLQAQAAINMLLGV